MAIPLITPLKLPVNLATENCMTLVVLHRPFLRGLVP
jgi:hypothetical protein